MSAHPTPLRLARSVGEIERLHDLLLRALRASDAGLLQLPAGGRENCHGMLNLCCWLLDHPDGAAIEAILAGLPLLLDDAGAV